MVHQKILFLCIYFCMPQIHAMERRPPIASFYSLNRMLGHIGNIQISSHVHSDLSAVIQTKNPCVHSAIIVGAFPGLPIQIISATALKNGTLYTCNMCALRTESLTLFREHMRTVHGYTGVLPSITATTKPS